MNWGSERLIKELLINIRQQNLQKELEHLIYLQVETYFLKEIRREMGFHDSDKLSILMGIVFNLRKHAMNYLRKSRSLVDNKNISDSGF